MCETNGSSAGFATATKLFMITFGVIFCQFSTPVVAQNTSIEYDHFVLWNFDEYSVKITVKGIVPFEFAEQFFVLRWCPANQEASDYVKTGAAILRGKGTITSRGELNIFDEDDPEDYCELWFEHPVEVVLNGKTWWKPNDIGCSDETFNFQLDEDWTKEVNWHARCADPEHAATLKMMLPKNLHAMLYSGEGRTLQFTNYEGAVLEDVAFYGMPPMTEGKLRYIFHSASWSGTDWNPKGSQLRFDPSRPKPRDYPVPKGEWGPPLSEIRWKTLTE